MLAEKYRPKCWSEVVAQPKVLRQIETLRPRGLAGRAYWLSGASGQGKTSIGRLLAAEVADAMNVVEIDAGELTADRLRDLERLSHLYGMGAKSGRAFIINEAHGLRAPIIRSLLVLLEQLPNHIIWVFTTTVDGQDKLFDGQIDAHPLLDRCIVLALTRQGIAKPAAQHVKAIAEREGLDGQPLERYVRLANECGGSFRAMLQRVESGCMLGE